MADRPRHPAMPPLGPPYAPGDAPPPPPRFPETPPEQWPTALIPAWGQRPTPPPVPPGPKTFTPAVIAALVTFVVVLAGAFAYSQTGGTDGSALPLPTTTTTAPVASSQSQSAAATTTTVPAALEAVVEDIKAFVERERGLEFVYDVEVTLADDATFVTRLLADFEETRSQVEELGQVMVALGLLDKDEDVVADTRTLVAAAAGGFYDPATKEVVVRATSTTPLTRQILAHELTHALDDQHFNLDRPQLDTADDESAFGFTALIEGNARRVEDAYAAAMTPEDRSAAERERLELLARHPELLRIPSVLLLLVDVPYTNGETFVLQVLANGAQPRLDAAFSAPPTTSEQVLVPSKYLAGEGPVVVDPPDTLGGAKAENRGVLGAIIFSLLLQSAGSDPSSVVAQWGGDQYVTWFDGVRTCLRDTLVGADPPSTVHLGETMALWARLSGTGATVENDARGNVVITACQ